MLNGIINRGSTAVNTTGDNTGVDTDANFISTSVQNVAVGHEAMGTGSLDGAIYNIAVGTQALENLVGGVQNVAVGYQSLNETTSGVSNTAIGHMTGKGLVGNNQNTILGNQALTNSSAQINGSVAIGYSSMQADLTTGADYTVAIGYAALQKLTSGTGNVAIGHESCKDIIVGNKNTCVGMETMQDTDATFTVTTRSADITGTTNTIILNAAEANLAVGQYVTGSGIPDNTIITAVTSTSDPAEFDLSANISSTVSGGTTLTLSGGKGAHENTFIGYKSGGGTWNSSGVQKYNTAVGSNSMQSALAGAIRNTAMGYLALSNLTSADDNTAIGYSAGSTKTSGGANTFVGAFCGDGDTTGSYDTAVGRAALTSDSAGYNSVLGSHAGYNLTGSENVAIGSDSLYLAEAVDRTVAVGFKALFSANENDCDGAIAIGYNAGRLMANTGGAERTGGNTLMGYSVGFQSTYGLTTGTKNTAIGFEAFGCNAASNLTADRNTVMGYRAGYSLAGDDCNDNVFIGKEAGHTVTEGAQNTLIGTSTAPSAVGGDNQIVIGYDATGVGDNTAIIGNSSVTDVYMGDNGSTWSTTSDGRLKENVKSWKTGLAEIKKLNIVSYNFKKDNPYGYNSKKVRQGIIAQEAVNAIPEMIDTSKEWMSANQEPMIWALVNAVQELSQQIEDLKKG